MKIEMKYLVIACYAIMLATGCSQDDLVATHADGDVTQASLEIASAGLQSEITATPASSELGTGASIGIFLGNATGSDVYVAKSNVQYNHEATSWTPALEAQRIYLTLSNAIVCAYYPYRAPVTDATGVSLAPRILVNGEVPLAYATNQTVNYKKKDLTFFMKQACSWLELNITRGDMPDDVVLTDIILKGEGLCKEYLLNITDGTLSEKIAANGDMVTLDAHEIVLSKNNSNNPVICNISIHPIDDAINGGLTIGVKIKEYNKTLSTKITGLTVLARATKYRVNLTVDGTALRTTSVEVLPWTTSTINNEGDPLVPLP